MWHIDYTLKRHRCSPLGRQWTPYRTSHILLSLSCQSNRRTIDTERTFFRLHTFVALAVSGIQSVPAARTPKIRVPERVNKLYLDIPFIPFPFRYSSFFFLLCDPFFFLGIGPLLADTKLVFRQTNFSFLCVSNYMP